MFDQLKSMRLFSPTVFAINKANLDRFVLGDVRLVAPSKIARSFMGLSGRSTAARIGALVRNAFFYTHAKRIRPRVALVHFGPDAMSAKRWLSFAGVPFVVVFHGFDATQFIAGRSFDEAYPGLLDSAAKIVAVSQHVKRALVASGVPDGKVTVLYLGVFVSPTPPPAHDYKGVVLQVGRLLEKKGHETSLRAFERARRRHPDLTFRIVGSGPLQEDLKALTTRLEIADSVTFVGDIPQEQVRRELQLADIFIHPSVTAVDGDTEGLPITILEAMAAGLPVISTIHAGIPEAVGEKTGLLIEEHDVDHAAASLIALAESEKLRRSLGSAAYELVRGEFNIEVNTARLELLVKSVARD